MTAHATENDQVIPPMPERTPDALRAAVAEHTPELLPGFDAHWIFWQEAEPIAPPPAEP
ncbi:hypothetical protein ACWGKQ_39875 [Streptomyces sp. NPDC054770]